MNRARIWTIFAVLILMAAAMGPNWVGCKSGGPATPIEDLTTDETRVTEPPVTAPEELTPAPGEGETPPEAVTEAEEEAPIPEQWFFVSAGSYYTCAIEPVDLSLWCWGNNDGGQLGIGSDELKINKPEKVKSDIGWRMVATSNSYERMPSHTCGIKTDGSLWCWGNNEKGQLGLGSFGGFEKEPKQLGAEKWNFVATGGQSTCGIKEDDTLWCWGNNREGQLGSIITAARETANPIPLPSLRDAKWNMVAISDSHTCAIKQDDLLMWCWGDNRNGQLGLGIPFPFITAIPPNRIRLDYQWNRVTVFDRLTCGLNASSKLYCWGQSLKGQLGTGDPVPGSIISTPFNIEPARTWSYIDSKGYHTCGSQTIIYFGVNCIYCWGDGERGQLGTGAVEIASLPTYVSCDNWYKPPRVLLGPPITTGNVHTCALKNDMSLWCWGDNEYGQLGDGTYERRIAPVQIAR